MGLHAWRIVSISLVAGLVLSGCGDPEPTVAEAEKVLKSHTGQILKNVFAVDIEVTDLGDKNIPCGNDRYKRTYAVKARAGAGSGDPEIVTLMLIGTLDSVSDYKLIKDGMTQTYQQAVSVKYRHRLVLSSPGKGRIEVRGETECLPLT
ncbi:hypothetical protein ACFHYQ_18555 [Sphaerimonospora cavernae]|uniref:Lipoprotein n=1 Tax=Sphaerimonospora cavernae TaxID=1740611 RepID=A0ABV6U755_9ACTN